MIAPSSNQPFAFVLMPFASNFKDIYEIGIKQTARMVGVVTERVDEQRFTENILEQILRQINSADIIIAEMTGKNPNVFYELGHAHAKGKSCVLIAQTSDDIPFDLKHHRCLIYGGELHILQGMLRDELTWMKSEIEKKKSSIFEFKITHKNDILNKTEWYHEGVVDLMIEVRNISDRRSPEIDHIFIATSDKWNLYDKDQKCESRPHNTKNHLVMHQISPSTRRISSGAWLSFGVTAKRKFWSKFSGNEPESEKYTARGEIEIEIHTEDGNFKYKEFIEIDFEEFPF